jgi:hypothetical protein
MAITDIRGITVITHAAITAITGDIRIIALTTTAGGRTITAGSEFTDTTSIIIAIIKQRLV